jgi:hypothetical protein
MAPERTPSSNRPVVTWTSIARPRIQRRPAHATARRPVGYATVRRPGSDPAAESPSPIRRTSEERHAMKDRILTKVKKRAKTIMVRRRRGDALITKPSRSTRPGRLYQ